MNGELDYDDILHFPKEIVVEKINNYHYCPKKFSHRVN